MLTCERCKEKTDQFENDELVFETELGPSYDSRSVGGYTVPLCGDCRMDWSIFYKNQSCHAKFRELVLQEELMHTIYNTSGQLTNKILQEIRELVEQKIETEIEIFRLGKEFVEQLNN